MKCAKAYLDVKIAQSNVNLDLSIKHQLDPIRLWRFFIMLCSKMLLVFYYFHRILLSNLVPLLRQFSIYPFLPS